MDDGGHAFEFEVEYAPGYGTLMAVPHALSRDTMDSDLMLCQSCLGGMETEAVQDVTEARAELSMEENSGKLSVESLLVAQREEYGGDLEHVSKQKGNWVVGEDGLIYQISDYGRIVVPRRLRDVVIRSVHGNRAVGHWGIVRMAKRLRRRYCWPGWTRVVAMFVHSCLICSLTKMGKPTRHGRMQVYHPSRRFEFVTVDILEVSPRSRDGNRKVIVMGDMFTRFMMAVPVCDETAATVASTFLDRWILLFGPPEKLSDRGKVFLGDVIRRICGKVGTKRFLQPDTTRRQMVALSGSIGHFVRILQSSSWTRPIGITTWQLLFSDITPQYIWRQNASHIVQCL
jgi:Integrase zinc binding domain